MNKTLNPIEVIRNTANGIKSNSEKLASQVSYYRCLDNIDGLRRLLVDNENSEIQPLCIGITKVLDKLEDLGILYRLGFNVSFVIELNNLTNYYDELCNLLCECGSDCHYLLGVSKDNTYYNVVVIKETIQYSKSLEAFSNLIYNYIIGNYNVKLNYIQDYIFSLNKEVSFIKKHSIKDNVFDDVSEYKFYLHMNRYCDYENKYLSLSERDILNIINISNLVGSKVMRNEYIKEYLKKGTVDVLSGAKNNSYFKRGYSQARKELLIKLMDNFKENNVLCSAPYFLKEYKFLGFSKEDIDLAKEYLD